MESAKKDADNPFFKSKYADLSSVVEALRGPFAEQGLAYVQLPHPSDTQAEEVLIETVLMHASGQWISSLTVVPVTKKDAQGYGSAMTYARRYGLQAMAGLAAEDDDGNAAASAKPSRKREPEPAKPLGETIEQEAERLFVAPPLGSDPLPEVDLATQRNLLLGQIKGTADKLGLKAPKRAELWTKYCAGTTPETADPAVLSDLLKALRDLSRAQ